MSATVDEAILMGIDEGKAYLGEHRRAGPRSHQRGPEGYLTDGDQPCGSRGICNPSLGGALTGQLVVEETPCLGS